MTPRLKHPARLSISYPTGGDSRRRVANIRIEDPISGCTIVDLEIDLYHWALAQTALQNRPAYMDFYAGGFGKIPEYKHEWVGVDKKDYDIRNKREKYLKSFEVDGWRANISDLGNPHRGSERNGVRGYLVGFHRLVEPTAEAYAERLKKFKEQEALENPYDRE